MKKLINILSIVAISTTTSIPLVTNTKITNSTLNIQHQNLKLNNNNLFEKSYRFWAHDWLKVKINYDTFLDMITIYDNKTAVEIWNDFFRIINHFPKIDNIVWWGSITPDDIDVTIDVIIKHFTDINNVFKKLQPENQGLLIVTNTIRSWDQNDNMGVYPQ